MPPASGQTTARSRRAGRRRRPPVQTRAQQVRNARAQQAAYVSQGRAVAHVAHQQRAVRRARRVQQQTAQARPLSPRPVTPRRVGPSATQRRSARRSLGFNPNLGNLRPAQQRASQRAQRAQQRVSARPMPHVPVIDMPTRAQAQAAHDLIARAINQQVTGRTPAERARSRTQIVREIQTDPRHREFLAASSHYARALERRNAIVIARGGRPTQTQELADLLSVARGTRNVRALRATPPAQPEFAGTRRENLAGLAQTAKDFAGIGPSPRGREIRAGRAQTRYQQQRDRYTALAAPKARRVGIGPAKVNITPAATRLGGAAAAALAQTSLNTGDLGPRIFARNVGRDVGSLATGPFVGGYELGRGTYEAATGRGTQRLQTLARGVASSLAEQVAHPIRSFEEHPLLSGLTVAGGIGAAGRVSGALARGLGSRAAAGGLRGALARGGSTVRPPLAFVDDAGAAHMARSYSKDITRKAIQVAQDARREPLTRADGSIVTVMDRGREVPVLKATPWERRKMGQRQGNFEAGRQNAVEREVRQEAGHEFGREFGRGSAVRAKVEEQVKRVARREAERVGIRGKNAQNLVGMVVDGTITSARHFEADLKSYRAMVQGEINRHLQGHKIYRTANELRQAREQVANIDRILADKRVLGQKEKIVRVGEDLGRRLNEREREAIRLGVLDQSRAGRARLIHPAVLHLGAKHLPAEELRRMAGVTLEEVSRTAAEDAALRHGALRAGDGTFLSNRHIEEALRAKGRDPETVAYLPPEALGRRAFHARFNLSRGMIGGGETRTGEQFRRGLTGSDAKTVTEQGVRLAVQTSKARGVDRVVGEYGMRHPKGRDFTGKEAREYADRIEQDTGEQLIPVRRVPAKADAEMQRLARAQQNPRAMESLNQRLINDRIKVDDSAKNVVLMPKHLVDRLMAHAAPTPALIRPFQVLNGMFRAAVLPQPRWLTGNFAEPYVVRLTAAGSGLNVFGLARDLIATPLIARSLKRQAASLRAAGNVTEAARYDRALQEIGAQQFGMGLFVGQRGATVRRELEEMPGAETWGPVIAKMPAVKEMVAFSRLVGRTLMAPANAFFRVNRIIETGATRAAFGRQAGRDIQELTGSWAASWRLGQKAVDEAARGLVNTPTQRRFMDMQYELLGKYQGFGPTTRMLTQTVLPFIPWMLNAARFVFWTMPAHNTVKAAFLQQINDVVSQDWQDIHKDVPPGSLKYAVKTKDGGWIDLARYTPFGAFTDTAGGGGYRTFTSQLLPQIEGPRAALEGRDPFGRELQAPKTPENPTGKANELEVAANSAIEALFPYVAQIRRLREGGGTAYPTSTVLDPQVKPGTTGQMGAVRRTFDPLRPTYLRAPSRPVAGGSTGAGAQRSLRRAQQAARRAGNTAAMERALRRARRAAGGG